MAARPAPPRQAAAPSHWPLILVIVALAATNGVSNLLLPDVAYIPFALATATALTAFAVLVDGRSHQELGWDRTHLARGIRWGLVLVAVVAAVYAAGTAIPETRQLFEDRRVEDLDGTGILYQSLLRVPFGTVALEEVAFRSVLLAMLLARTDPFRAAAASSLLFGLWHVLPVLGMGSVNPVQDEHLDGVAGTAIALAGGVAGTTLAGLVFCWLRLRTGSLAPPIMVHWATNGLGYLAAWIVLS